MRVGINLNESWQLGSQPLPVTGCCSLISSIFRTSSLLTKEPNHAINNCWHLSIHKTVGKCSLLNLAALFVYGQSISRMVCYQSLSLDELQVLVVESDPDSRYLLTLLLEEYGVEMIAATSTDEAIKILKQLKLDLLISEIRLPKEDGYSLMHKVKTLKMQKQVQIPAIPLTTYARKGDRAHGLSVGFEEHLPKPFDINKLITTVTCLTQHV